MLKPNAASNSQVWKKTNTILLGLSATDALSDGYDVKWNLDFIESYNSLPAYSGNDVSRTCYLPNVAFSSSFEEFSQNLVINDASDEDKCRNA